MNNMAGSLYERLVMGEQAMLMDEDESIRNHLERMLGARQGAVLTLPDDYGLPDLNDLSMSRSELQFYCCQAIETCINKYEPRLTQVKVTQGHIDEGSFDMTFNIEALKIDSKGQLSNWNNKVFLNGKRLAVKNG
jgi:type VI secretion system protein